LLEVLLLVMKNLTRIKKNRTSKWCA